MTNRFSFSRISTRIQSSSLTNDDLSLLQNSCGVLGNFCSIPKGIRTLRQLSILPSITTLIAHAHSLNSQRTIDVLLWALENFAASTEGSEQIRHSQVPFALIHYLLHPYLQYDLESNSPNNQRHVAAIAPSTRLHLCDWCVHSLVVTYSEDSRSTSGTGRRTEAIMRATTSSAAPSRESPPSTCERTCSQSKSIFVHFFVINMRHKSTLKTTIQPIWIQTPFAPPRYSSLSEVARTRSFSLPKLPLSAS